MDAVLPKGNECAGCGAIAQAAGPAMDRLNVGNTAVALCPECTTTWSQYYSLDSAHHCEHGGQGHPGK